MTVRRCIHLPFILLSLGFFTGCGQKNTFVAPPPPEVDVQKPLIEDTTIYLEVPGRTRAFSRVEIRARVKGFLLSREFHPGDLVKEGQILFKIDPSQYITAENAAKAKLDDANANLKRATTEWEKKKIAAEKKAVAEIEVLAAEADAKMAAAGVEMAQAALDAAELDLSYTEVLSPIDGRVSRDLVDQGNLVGATDPTLLTTVVQDNPVYFNFEVNERTILPFLKKRPDSGTPKTGELGAKKADLKLTLSDGTDYPVMGKFDFIDNAVDEESGTIKVRAVFENAEGNLADGLFARISLPETIKGAVLVPKPAIQRDLGGSYVLLVGAENKVERRVVIPTPFSVGLNRVIKPFDEETNSGVKPEDRIIVSNLQRARAGIEVAPKEMEAEKASAEPAPEPKPDPAPKPEAEKEAVKAPAEQK